MDPSPRSQFRSRRGRDGHLHEWVSPRGLLFPQLSPSRRVQTREAPSPNRKSHPMRCRFLFSLRSYRTLTGNSLSPHQTGIDRRTPSPTVVGDSGSIHHVARPSSVHLQPLLVFPLYRTHNPACHTPPNSPGSIQLPCENDPRQRAVHRPVYPVRRRSRCDHELTTSHDLSVPPPFGASPTS